MSTATVDYFSAASLSSRAPGSTDTGTSQSVLHSSKKQGQPNRLRRFGVLSPNPGLHTCTMAAPAAIFPQSSQPTDTRVPVSTTQRHRQDPNLALLLHCFFAAVIAASVLGLLQGLFGSAGRSCPEEGAQAACEVWRDIRALIKLTVVPVGCYLAYSGAQVKRTEDSEDDEVHTSALNACLL